MILINPLQLLKDVDNFVKNHPDGSIFQSFNLYNVYNLSTSHEPLMLVSKDEDQQINGVLLGVIAAEGSGVKKFFSRRSIVFFGPLALNDDERILFSLLAKYNKLVRSKAIFTQIRNGRDRSDSINLFKRLGYQFEDHLDILHCLRSSEEELWKKMDYSKRKNINNANNNGLEVKIFKLNEQLDEAYSILRNVYLKAKLPLNKKEFFKIAADNLGENLVCIGAYKENLLVGFRAVLCFKGLVYDWYAGSDEQYLKFRPNDLLVWEVIKWAKSHNYEYFDFGGAGKPNIPYGVRDYKLKFGGELVNYGRFQVVHNHLLYKIAKIGLSAIKIAYGLRKQN